MLRSPELGLACINCMALAGHTPAWGLILIKYKAFPALICDDAGLNPVCWSLADITGTIHGLGSPNFLATSNYPEFPTTLNPKSYGIEKQGSRAKEPVVYLTASKLQLSLKWARKLYRRSSQTHPTSKGSSFSFPSQFFKEYTIKESYKSSWRNKTAILKKLCNNSP